MSELPMKNETEAQLAHFVENGELPQKINDVVTDSSEPDMEAERKKFEKARLMKALEEIFDPTELRDKTEAERQEIVRKKFVKNISEIIVSTDCTQQDYKPEAKRKKLDVHDFLNSLREISEITKPNEYNVEFKEECFELMKYIQELDVKAKENDEQIKALQKLVDMKNEKIAAQTKLTERLKKNKELLEKLLKSVGPASDGPYNSSSDESTDQAL